jgi:uncharacterized MnhB-related membrane protein
VNKDTKGMVMLYTVLLVIAIFCAIQAIRAAQLLAAALWLAGVSVFLAIAFYVMGAREVAVIELSVGAGLVTVLMVFAIAISGEDAIKARALVPLPLSFGLIALTILILGWLILPAAGSPSPSPEPSFAIVLWEQRGLDALLQIGLIFAGVLAVLGLLNEAASKPAEDVTPTQAENEHSSQAANALDTAYEDQRALEEQPL